MSTALGSANEGIHFAILMAMPRGRLAFGPWERIFYGELDGRRRKRVLVKIVGE